MGYTLGTVVANALVGVIVTGLGLATAPVWLAVGASLLIGGYFAYKGTQIGSLIW